MAVNAHSDQPVRIHLASNRAFIWDIDDIEILRAQHRICGILTGTLPQHSQQNVFLGAPLLLMPEEVVLLVERRFAVLVDSPLAQTLTSSSLTVEDLQRWAQAQRSRSQKQLKIQQEKELRLAELQGKKTSEEAIRKRAEREERKRQKALAAAASPAIDSSSLLENTTPPDEPHSEASASSFSQQSAAILIPSDSTAFQWYKTPPEVIYTTIEAAKSAGIWSFPSTQFDRSRCAIFYKLWEKGYFMGGGTKFGGEYLVYPGDPLRYHSHFSASVLESPDAPLRPMEIVAHGRLGTATKKAHLLCAWDEEEDNVEFLSIEWAGFG